MLTKFESDHPINQYLELSQAWYWCVRAKNASSLKKRFSPEMLVLGKQTRMPGAVCSDEMLPAHFLADSDTAQAIANSWQREKPPVWHSSKRIMMPAFVGECSVAPDRKAAGMNQVHGS
jgi:hypothetical protein